MKITSLQIDKMTKHELSKLLYDINSELYFKTSPRLATTKNFRVIIKKELSLI